MEEQNKVSDAQKAAQKKYDQKTKTISIKYTPADMDEYIKLKDYIETYHYKMNSFVKRRVHQFLLEQEKRRKNEWDIDDEVALTPYHYFQEGDWEFIENTFEPETIKKIIVEFRSVVESEFENVLWEKAEGLNYWVTDLKDQLECGELSTESSKDNDSKLINDLLNNI